MFDRKARLAFILLCVALVVFGVGFRAAVEALNITLQKERVELRDHFATLPRTIGDWKAVGEDRVLDAATVETLGTEKYLDRTYMRMVEGERQQLEVHVAYYTGMIDAVPHVPDRCLQAAGLGQQSLPQNLKMDVDDSQWPRDPNTVNLKTGEAYPTTMFSHHITAQPVRVHLPLGDFELRTTEFSLPMSSELKVFAGYFFIANGHMTPMPWGVKKLAFDPRDEYAYYCKVQYTMPVEQDAAVDEYLSIAADFTEDFLPRLMRCLPDWPEVERRHLTEQRESSGPPTSG